MERDSQGIAAKVEHARRVGVFMQRLGWVVVGIGVVAIASYAALWATGELDVDQGVSLILGTALGVALSGATPYAAGINLVLGAERLKLAAKDTSAFTQSSPGP